ncbi:leucyl-tRNA synthetase [Rickettsia prowazekii str. GvV257]|uniref:leucine--tRNA ligase n=1 Tax=Rickettsia prowazekii TaxID=782 RepID=UPI000256BE29|nr:leucine--tRNA ligase [Rickettsia prowazekii]AFE52857.1 leucyl-tRNA synthetase [Rickettsia prowazekii str. GvV257]AFE53428.1 leucyl-tRNA synthetase [Rickettsia prowazekii str. RpGvF24]EOB09788.1 Leucine--tRNA ligase [Rickettsia prowazekii str. GvF12]
MHKIEKKWQKIWQEEKAFQVSNESSKPKYYVLEMLPYPSGKIHIGHVRNYSIGDVIARFMTMQGFNVLHPMGWDAFGLPAENAAIKNNSRPQDWTYSNIEYMKKQLQSMGFAYDWTREINSCDPEYYKHEQKFFLELYDRNLVYQKESLVNWDPVDNTVLANEQVVDGRGWRSGAIIEKRYLKQWFLKITDYAEELLNEIQNLKDWPAAVRVMQEEWIGKSTGVNFHFKVKYHENTTIEVFSTKPETIFGASFIGIAFNHPIIEQLICKTPEIVNFITKCSYITRSSEIDKAEKEGIFSGLYVIHPFDANIFLPVIITNFVLMDYGTGAIFGCPAHDKRDHELAIKMNLPIKQVIETGNIQEGILINSDWLNGLTSSEAKQKVIEKFEKLGIGKRSVNYRLKDWSISRQRFWGCPIPMIHCKTCGVVPVPYKDLPVTLPDDVSFDSNYNSLEHHSSWKYVNCPKCDNSAIRETDTFDTFFESSWYFTRYCNSNAVEMTDKKACNYWLPVDKYIGGIEHAVMHLLYARFFTKLMNEHNYVSIREPFKGLFTQGMVLHATYKDENNNWLYPAEVVKKGNEFFHKENNTRVVQGRIEKMSKSKKNIIDLETIREQYSADAIRLFVLSDSPPEKDLEWSASGIEGCSRFINKLENMFEAIFSLKDDMKSEINKDLNRLIHLTIKHVADDIKTFSLNRAIARMRTLTNAIYYEISKDRIDVRTIKYGFNVLVQLLNPFIPHITEEIWQKLGNKERLYKSVFAEFDESILELSTYIMAVQVNGKLRDTYEFDVDISEDEVKQITVNLPKVQKFLAGKEPRNIILVPRKIVNIIV